MNKFVVSIALAIGLVLTCATTITNHYAEGSVTTVKTNLSFIIPILNINNPNYDIRIIKPFLKANDIVVFPAKNYKQVSLLKNSIPGLKIATGGVSADVLISGISHIPKNVDYLTYDYERGQTPEWTTNQTESIATFEKLHVATTNAGKKLIIAPVYVYGMNWDWGEVAKHTDVMLVQVQNFQTGASVPDSAKPSSLGINMTGVVQKITNQVKLKSPSTQLYFLFGFDVIDNPNNILVDINTVNNLGINGVALWYNSGTNSSTTKIDMLPPILQNVTRN